MNVCNRCLGTRSQMVGRGVKPRLVLRVAEATYFLDYACVSAMRTVLPFHVQALGSGGFGVGALESLFGLGQVAGALVIGRLSDAAGRRLALLLCFACAMVGYVLVALAMATGSTALFFISRVPAGLSKQTVTLARSLVSDVTPTAQRSTALSRLSACGCFGYAVGPLAGGVLSDAGSGARLAAGCAASFAALAPLVLLVLPETRPDSVTGSRAAESSPAAATQPHAELQAWRKQDVLAALCACALPEAAFVMLTATSLPLVAKQTLGWSSTELGKFNSATGLGAGLFSFAALPRLLRDGRLSDVRALQTGELALCVVSMLMLYAPGSATLWACLPLAVLCASLLRSFPVSLVSKAASESRRGTALGMLDLVSSTCRIVMPTAAGLCIDRFGPLAPLAVQAALSAAGIAALLAWQHQQHARDSHLTPLAKRKDE